MSEQLSEAGWDEFGYFLKSYARRDDQKTDPQDAFLMKLVAARAQVAELRVLQARDGAEHEKLAAKAAKLDLEMKEREARLQAAQKELMALLAGGPWHGDFGTTQGISTNENSN